MTLLLRRGWLLLLMLLSFAVPTALAQREGKVVKIEIVHEGPPACSDSLIRGYLRLKEGDVYNHNAINDDIRSLYGTGYFFNIEEREEEVDGGIKLIYRVQGKPTVTQILFTGNKKLSSSKLRKKISSKVGQPMDERKLFSDKQEILKLYQKSGRQKTTVEYVPVIDKPLGKGTITFEITEAPKVKIKDVQFINGTAFSQRKLRMAIKTRRHWMFSWLTGSGVLKDEQFEDDKEKLADFYREHGYIDFEIKDIKFDQIGPKWQIIRFTVNEGSRYRVGSVAFEGNQLFATNEILSRIYTRDGNQIKRGLTMTSGDVFTPKGLSRDLDAIDDFYGARGYIDARVRSQNVPNTEHGTMDVVFKIDEGSQSRIERIEIKGNIHTKDKVVRRELAVNPGEIFNMVRVRLSTNRLHGLNYFAKVDAQPEPSPDLKDHKDLVISLEEKNTGNVRAGAGFSTVENLVGFVEVSQGNFDLFKPPLFLGTGAGQKIRLRAQYGTKLQDYELTFIEPWFMGRKLALSVDLFYREMDYYSTLYNVREAGARLGLSRTLWNDYWIGNISYTLENVGLVDMPAPGTYVDTNGVVQTSDSVPPQIRAEQGYTLVSKIGTSIAYDTRNSVMLPDRGQRTALLTEFAGGPFGGDTDFYKLELDTSRYFRGFAPGHVLELVGQIGVVDNHSGDANVHLFDRWFLGGLYNLRGYKYHAVGPYDSTGTEPLGGRTFWFATAEYSIPIIERVRLAAFYDVGNVYPDAYSFRTLNSNYGLYSDNWGVGILLNIPSIGPLRLDYAVPITHDQFTSGSGRFQFGVGFTREYQ